jgi:hypothetical protein
MNYQQAVNNLICKQVESRMIQRNPSLAFLWVRTGLTRGQKVNLIREMYNEAVSMGAVPIKPFDL